MSLPSEILQEVRLDDVGTLTAYQNESVKAQFLDRTIVRAQKGCYIIKILNKRGDQLMINMIKPNETLLN